MQQTAQSTRTEYAVGAVLVLISAVTFSTAGVFTKGVEAGSWDVIFWRGIFAAAFTTLWTYGRGTLRQNFVCMGTAGVAIGVIGALGAAAFISSFKFTTIANVSIIYAASPLIAALLAWLLMGERATPRTLAGSVAAFAGVAVIFSASPGHLNLLGDLMALWMAVVMASIMVLYRKYPGTPGAGPAVLSSVLLLPAALIFGNPFDVAGVEVGVLTAFGLLFAIASVTLAEGAKRVPAGQTALLSILETPLAPVFAFVLLAQIPTLATFAGGAVVVGAVVFSMKRNA